VVHFSGDVTESDGLPRRRAFSLSFGMRNSNSIPHSLVPRESPLVLKSSSVSSMASRDVEDSESVIGKLMSSFLVVKVYCPWFCICSAVVLLDVACPQKMKRMLLLPSLLAR